MSWIFSKSARLVTWWSTGVASGRGAVGVVRCTAWRMWPIAIARKRSWLPGSAKCRGSAQTLRRETRPVPPPARKIL
eukprot:symbB.v1.2.030770.t1/scaffold3505.1/size55173/2